MKRILLSCIMASMILAMYAQATDLVIDNQTPGWLSSKINYGDQLTVKNLKVTGYINNTDLKFIGTLFAYSLTEKLDLSEVNIVKESSSGKDNYIGLNAFGTTTATLSKCILPKSLKEISNCFYNVSVDTLVFDCNINYIKKDFFGKIPTNIVLGENVDSIPDNAFSGSGVIKSIDIKGHVRYIGDKAFYNNPIEKCNFPEGIKYIGHSAFYGHKMKKIIFPEIVQTIGTSAFHNTKEIYEIVLPKQMKDLGSKAFDNYAPMEIKVPYGIVKAYMNSFKFSEGQTWYFPETVEFISEITCDNKNCVFHLESTKVVGIDSKLLHSTISVEEAMRNAYLSGLTVYVPKGMVQQYKGSNYWYTARYQDEDRSSGTYYWSKGYYVTCYWAPATFMEESYSVSGISLSQSELSFNEIGETKILYSIVEPSNADEKSVNWTTTNQNVCIVDPTGKIVATGYGTAVIICSTVDGGYIATCVIMVTESSGINNIEITNKKESVIYTISGVRVYADSFEDLPKGIYIVNGKKVVK